VGADVGLHVGKNFLEAFPERAYPAQLIVKLNEAKRLGEKTGAGFYKFDAKRKAKPDPALAPIVEASRKVGLRRSLTSFVHVCNEASTGFVGAGSVIKQNVWLLGGRLCCNWCAHVCMRKHQARCVRQACMHAAPISHRCA
jgi:hypothetical protein